MADGSWDCHIRDGKVVLIIRGHYTTQNAIASSDRVFAAFSELGKGEFVADFTDATGFDRDGRVHWQTRLSELREHVHTVTMINGPALMRMAAAAVCLYAGIKLRTLAKLEDAFGPTITPHTS